MILRPLALTLATLCAGCSTSFWYTQIQGAQYDKCDKLQDAESRRRCREATFPDKDKYDKDRQPAAPAK
jgi:hypothetical protein